MFCNTLNCIYVIKCQGYQKMYIGETSYLRFRTNLHRDHAAGNIGLKVSRHLHECAYNKYQNTFLIKPFFKITSDVNAMRKYMENLFIKNF